MPAILEATRTAPPPTAAPRFAAARERLDQLARLEPNWDGYNAPRIDTATIAAARELLDALAPAARAGRESDTFPAIVPLSSGAVQVEWHVGERILELEFETAERIHFLKWWPQKGVAVEESYPASDRARSLTLIEWVLSGHDPK